MAIFCWASGLYVFPAIELYYTPAIKLFGYEKANGVGEARDIVLQGFIRYITIAFFPIVVSVSLLYLLVHFATEFIQNEYSPCSFIIIGSEIYTIFSTSIYSSVSGKHMS